MDPLVLPVDLEEFASEAVASGRYRDRAAMLVAGMSLLQRQERARADLLASVLAAKEEAERDGYLTGDDVETRVRATIERRRATPA